MKIVLRLPIDDESYEILAGEVGNLLKLDRPAFRAELEQWCVKKLLHGTAADLQSHKPTGARPNATPSNKDKA